MNRPNRQNPLVLMADDDSTLQMLLKAAMTQEGFDVVQASNGEQCLQDFARVEPDMVLLDAMMPGMDGFECCRKLRELPNGKQTPILMITVLDKPEYVDQAFSAGATDYITKPIYWAVLSHRVQRLYEAYKNAQNMQRTLENFGRYQAWETLQSQCLDAIQTQSPEEFTRFSLETLQKFLGNSHVLLYRQSSQSWLESNSGIPELGDRPLEQALNYWKNDIAQQESAIVVTGNEEAPIDTALQSLGETLQSPAFCLQAVNLQDHVQDLLLVCNDNKRNWTELEQKCIRHVADFLAIAQRLNK